MITSNKLYTFWISQLKARKEGDSLYAEQTPVNIIAEEKIIRMGTVSAYSHKFNEIIELTA